MKKTGGIVVSGREGSKSWVLGCFQTEILDVAVALEAFEVLRGKNPPSTVHRAALDEYDEYSSNFQFSIVSYGHRWRSLPKNVLGAISAPRSVSMRTTFVCPWTDDAVERLYGLSCQSRGE